MLQAVYEINEGIQFYCIKCLTVLGIVQNLWVLIDSLYALCQYFTQFLDVL
jgi:hypothetical protein